MEIFLGRSAIVRLVGAVLAEHRRYLGIEALAAAQEVLTRRTTEQSMEDAIAGELTA